MADEVRIQIKFKKVYQGEPGDYLNGLEFNDCLYFTEPEYASITSEQIETMKDQRFQNWTDSIKNPPTSNDTPPVEE